MVEKGNVQQRSQMCEAGGEGERKGWRRQADGGHGDEGTSDEKHWEGRGQKQKIHAHLAQWPIFPHLKHAPGSPLNFAKRGPPPREISTRFLLPIKKSSLILGHTFLGCFTTLRKGKGNLKAKGKVRQREKRRIVTLHRLTRWPTTDHQRLVQSRTSLAPPLLEPGRNPSILCCIVVQLGRLGANRWTTCQWNGRTTGRPVSSAGRQHVSSHVWVFGRIGRRLV